MMLLEPPEDSVYCIHEMYVFVYVAAHSYRAGAATGPETKLVWKGAARL